MGQPPWGDDFAADFERRTVDLQAHLEEIAPTLRGLPFDVAEQRLRDELGARGVEATETVIGSVARMAADPSWPLRHPVEYRRWLGEQDERIHQHNAELEAEERARLVDLSGEDEADALLATDPVSEAVGRVRIERAVTRTGSYVDVRELTESDLPPWHRPS